MNLMKPREYRLENLLSSEVHQLVPKHIHRAIVPCGATEAHGSIGLGTDTIIPDGLAEKIAPEVEALIAPAVPYGVLRTLSRYPGSISLSPELYTSLMTQVGLDLGRAGFTQIIFLDGHAGNIGSLKEAAFTLHREHGLFALVYDWYLEQDDEGNAKPYNGFGGHSGAAESGLVRALRPEAAPEGLWKSRDAGTLNSAVSAYPGPYSIILETEGEGLPDFDEKKADEFLKLVAARTVASLSGVLERWEELEF
jgi:creatinine amidohydrolase/Fe(II)-dependent formamide hydrolase-like protein